VDFAFDFEEAFERVGDAVEVPHGAYEQTQIAEEGELHATGAVRPHFVQ
jgi:hypothetical protein